MFLTWLLKISLLPYSLYLLSYMQIYYFYFNLFTALRTFFVKECWLFYVHSCCIFINLFSCKPFRFDRQQVIKLSHFIDLFLFVVSPKAMLSVSAAVAKIVIAIALKPVE